MSFRNPLLGNKWKLKSYRTRWSRTVEFGVQKDVKELTATIETEVDAGILMYNSEGLINNAKSTLTDQKVYVGTTNSNADLRNFYANSSITLRGTWNVEELSVEIDGGVAYLSASLIYQSTDTRNATAATAPEGITP